METSFAVLNSMLPGGVDGARLPIVMNAYVQPGEPTTKCGVYQLAQPHGQWPRKWSYEER